MCFFFPEEVQGEDADKDGEEEHLCLEESLADDADAECHDGEECVDVDAEKVKRIGGKKEEGEIGMDHEAFARDDGSGVWKKDKGEMGKEKDKEEGDVGIFFFVQEEQQAEREKAGKVDMWSVILVAGAVVRRVGHVKPAGEALFRKDVRG